MYNTRITLQFKTTNELTYNTIKRYQRVQKIMNTEGHSQEEYTRNWTDNNKRLSETKNRRPKLNDRELYENGLSCVVELHLVRCRWFRVLRQPLPNQLEWLQPNVINQSENM